MGEMPALAVNASPHSTLNYALRLSPAAPAGLRWTLNSKLRRAVRAQGHSPSDEAASKLLYLVLHRSEKECVIPPRDWTMAKAQFAVLFGDRFVWALAA